MEMESSDNINKYKAIMKESSEILAKWETLFSSRVYSLVELAANLGVEVNSRDFEVSINLGAGSDSSYSYSFSPTGFSEGISIVRGKEGRKLGSDSLKHEAFLRDVPELMRVNSLTQHLHEIRKALIQKYESKKKEILSQVKSRCDMLLEVKQILQNDIAEFSLEKEGYEAEAKRRREKEAKRTKEIV